MTATGTFELALTGGGVDDEMVRFNVEVVAKVVDGELAITSVQSCELIEVIPQGILDDWLIFLIENNWGDAADRAHDEFKEQTASITKYTMAMFNAITGGVK